MFIGPSSYISINQDAQSKGMEVNRWKAKSKYSNPSVFPTLSHGIVFQSGGKINPRLVMWSTHGMEKMEHRTAKDS